MTIEQFIQKHPEMAVFVDLVDEQGQLLVDLVDEATFFKDLRIEAIQKLPRPKAHIFYENEYIFAVMMTTPYGGFVTNLVFTAIPPHLDVLLAYTDCAEKLTAQVPRYKTLTAKLLDTPLEVPLYALPFDSFVISAENTQTTAIVRMLSALRGKNNSFNRVSLIGWHNGSRVLMIVRSRLTVYIANLISQLVSLPVDLFDSKEKAQAYLARKTAAKIEQLQAMMKG